MSNSTTTIHLSIYAIETIYKHGEKCGFSLSESVLSIIRNYKEQDFKSVINADAKKFPAALQIYFRNGEDLQRLREISNGLPLGKFIEKVISYYNIENYNK